MCLTPSDAENTVRLLLVDTCVCRLRIRVFFLFVPFYDFTVHTTKRQWITQSPASFLGYRSVLARGVSVEIVFRPPVGRQRREPRYENIRYAPDFTRKIDFLSVSRITFFEIFGS